MRCRELIRKLREIRQQRWNCPLFPSRDDVHRAAQDDIKRLRELEKLLPEIIAKLERP